MDGLSLRSKILTGFRKPCCLVKLVSPCEEIGDHQVIGWGDGRAQFAHKKSYRRRWISDYSSEGVDLYWDIYFVLRVTPFSCMCAHLFVRELETATLDFCSHSISYIVRAIHIERLEIKSTCILEAYDIKSIVHRNYLAEIRFFGCLHVSFHLLLPLLMPITTIKTAIM